MRTYVIPARAKETGTKRRVKAVATVWIGARSACASSARVMIRPTTVSWPTEVARMVTEPLEMRVPAYTSLPDCAYTGRASPDSAVPSTGLRWCS
ncbi:hypothetical protein ADK35_38920 [Streptomyces viridochromogenes]|nr:hypothetical protein ADK35_38920 [Streptomyces viridochromogenes]KOG18168.1 hypothetical protein ADK36_23360 [Streptomyces viridochromogenes]